MKKRIILFITLLMMLISVVIMGYIYRIKNDDKLEIDIRNTIGINYRLETNYDEVKDYYNGLFNVVKNNKQGYIDKDGNVVISITFDTDEDYYIDCNYIKLKRNDVYYIYDNYGNLVYTSSNEISSIKSLDSDECYIIDKNKLIDKDYKIIFNSKYLYDYSTMIFDNKVYMDNKYYDLETNEYYDIDKINLIFEDKFLIEKDNKVYLYDINSKEETIYDEIKYGKDYVAFIKDGIEHYFDSYGKEVTKDLRNKEEIGNGYYLYSSKKGMRLYKDGKYITKYYDIIDTNKLDKDMYITHEYNNGNVIAYVHENNNVTRFNYDINYVGDYLISNPLIDYYDSLYDEHLKKVDNFKCNYGLEEIYDNYYLCKEDEMNYYLVDKDFNKLTDSYNNIDCINSVCVMSNELEKKSIYYLDKEVTYKGYTDVNIISDDYIVGKKVFGIDILKIGESNNLIDKERLNVTEDKSYIDINVDENILKYNLDNIKDIILKDEEFFKKYAYVVNNNNSLGDYKKQVMDLYIVVYKYKDYIDEAKFFDRLSYLRIEKKELDDEAVAGYYYYSDNSIEMSDDSKRVIYHELMHFIDFSINEDITYLDYECNNKIFKLKELNTLTKDELLNCEYLDTNFNFSFFEESGAETFMADYFNDKIPTVYEYIVDSYNLLSYLYGEDTINNIFIKNDGNYELYKLITTKGGLSYKEFKNFINLLNKIADVHYLDNDKDIIKLNDYFIKMNRNINKKFNKEFNFMISSNLIYIDMDTIKRYSKENNYYDKYYIDVYNMVDKIIKKYKYEYVYHRYNIENGKVLIIANAYKDINSGNFVIEYDYEKGKVINYKFIKE